MALGWFCLKYGPIGRLVYRSPVFKTAIRDGILCFKKTWGNDCREHNREQKNVFHFSDTLCKNNETTTYFSLLTSYVLLLTSHFSLNRKRPVTATLSIPGLHPIALFARFNIFRSGFKFSFISPGNNIASQVPLIGRIFFNSMKGMTVKQSMLYNRCNGSQVGVSEIVHHRLPGNSFKKCIVIH